MSEHSPTPQGWPASPANVHGQPHAWPAHGAGGSNPAGMHDPLSYVHAPILYAQVPAVELTHSAPRSAFTPVAVAIAALLVLAGAVVAFTMLRPSAAAPTRTPTASQDTKPVAALVTRPAKTRAATPQSVAGSLLEARADSIVVRGHEGAPRTIPIDTRTTGAGPAELQALAAQNAAVTVIVAGSGVAASVKATAEPVAAAASLTGIIVSVSESRLVLSAGGTSTRLTIRPADRASMEVAHLREHQQAGERVRVWYETQGPTRFAVRYVDA